MLPPRYWEKVVKTDTCWIWVGAKIPNGYGMFWKNGRHHGAHRISYEAFKGAIPATLQIDHLCRRKLCVNPDHLELVTSEENNRRALPYRGNPKRTLKEHCKWGHAFTDENTYIVPKDGRRICKLCANERTRKWKLAHL